MVRDKRSLKRKTYEQIYGVEKAEEIKKKLSESTTERAKNPTEKMLLGREKISKTLTEKWEQDENYRNNHLRWLESEEFSKLMSDFLTKQWADPNSAYNSKKHGEKISLKAIKRWENPTIEMIEGIREGIETRIQLWKDPEFLEHLNFLEKPDNYPLAYGVESKKHKRLKDFVVDFFKKRGFDTKREVFVWFGSGIVKRVDVVASKGKKKIAIECGSVGKGKLKQLCQKFDYVVHFPYNKKLKLLKGKTK